MRAIAALARRKQLFKRKPGHIMNSPPDIIKNSHHHQRRGYRDDRVTQQCQLPKLLIESRAACRAGYDQSGQNVVHQRRKEKGPAQEIGSIQKAGLKQGIIPCSFESLLNFTYIEHTRVV